MKNRSRKKSLATVQAEISAYVRRVAPTLPPGSDQLVREARKFLKSHAPAIAVAEKKAAELEAALRASVVAAFGPDVFTRLAEASTAPDPLRFATGDGSARSLRHVVTIQIFA